MALQSNLTDYIAGLKAVAESTRLRILLLLGENELNVKDLGRILGQSQPRISRHLKLLTQAGLLERYQEGSWVYFRLAERAGLASLIKHIVATIDMSDPVLQRDLERAEAVKAERSELAQDYFHDHAAEWDTIRSLHIAEEQVEAAMSEILGPEKFDLMVDLGTGTGRMLELFGEQFSRGIGVDLNHDMLVYARAKLEKLGASHCQIRHGDLFNLPFEDDLADVVIVHQVLHFLPDPLDALLEAARILRPGGRLLVVDFAPHELEFLRDNWAHQRLGFSAKQMGQWISQAGLELSAQKRLDPPAGEASEASDKLTVSLWLAHKSDDIHAARSADKKTGSHPYQEYRQ